MALELAYKMYSDVFDNYPILNKEEEINLMTLAKAGNKEAFDTLILSNIRLVVDISNRFSGRGISDEELIQQGIEGLIWAYQKFDISFNVRYATYASKWIEHFIRVSIADTGAAIRIPRNILHKLIALKEKLLLNQDVDLDAIAKEIGISNFILKSLIPYITPTASLDLKLSEEMDTMYDYIAVEDTYEKSLNKITAEQILSKTNLNDQEKSFIHALYYDEISPTNSVEELGVTRSRVYVVRDNALKKLSKYK